MAFNSSFTNNSLWQKLLTLIVLAVTFCLSAGTIVYFSLKGKEVNVPELLGKSEGEAEQLLKEQGLRLKVRNRTTSEKYAEHLVSEQTPNGGATVKAGQAISVIVSTGIEAKAAAASPTPKPSSAAKPKPSATPKKKDKEKEKDKKDEKKVEGEKGKVDKENKDGKSDSAKATPKPSPKPTVKPSPKKESTN